MEEMNKCRKLMAMCCRRLSDAGFDVVLPDLSGTGDSAGEFGEARWERWIQDLEAVRAWFSERSVADVEMVLAVRAGTLLLPSLLADKPLLVVAWQPVYEGRQYLQQILRLRVMASKFSGGNETNRDLMNLFESGESVEVAGYSIAAELAGALAEVKLTDLSFPAGAKCAVLECKPSGSEKLSLPGLKFLEVLDQQGIATLGEVLDCEQFWATQEISAPPQVAVRTVEIAKQWMRPEV